MWTNLVKVSILEGCTDFWRVIVTRAYHQQASVLIWNFDPSFVLVLLLTSPAPFWSDINALILLFVSLLLCLVHSGGLVLSRAVDSVEYEWGGPSVDKLMLGAGGDDDQIACLDVLILACDGCLTLAGGEGEDLVYSMDLAKC